MMPFAIRGLRVSAELCWSKRVFSQAVSLVIADDMTVRALNSEYRGLDKTTDVLSFAFDNEGEYYGEGDAPSDWSARMMSLCCLRANLRGLAR